MQMHRRPVLEGLRFAGENTDASGDALRGLMNSGCQHPVATANRFQIRAGQVQRAALARAGLLSSLALNLDAANPHFVASR